MYARQVVGGVRWGGHGQHGEHAAAGLWVQGRSPQPPGAGQRAAPATVVPRASHAGSPRFLLFHAIQTRPRRRTRICRGPPSGSRRRVLRARCDHAGAHAGTADPPGGAAAGGHECQRRVERGTLARQGHSLKGNALLSYSLHATHLWAQVELAHLSQLCERHSVHKPSAGVDLYIVDMGPYHLRCVFPPARTFLLSPNLAPWLVTNTSRKAGMSGTRTSPRTRSRGSSRSSTPTRSTTPRRPSSW